MLLSRLTCALAACAVLTTACSDGGGTADSAAIRQPTDSELAAAGFDKLPLAPDSDRVDLELPLFTHPTRITNPLFPISELHSVVFSGEVEGKPFHTETTLLPETRVIEWSDGKTVETAISQYFAFLDGRLEEVALDYYAQADDGSVWYFGEELQDYGEGGFVVSTEGEWLAGRDGPPAMIMPGHPEVGDVHRAENTPPIAFEEVSVDTIDKTVDGPSGTVRGALVARELHLDGTYSDKVFAPGYGEFFSDHDGDLEALALAVPTDAIGGDVPTELEDLATAVDDVFDAVRASRWDRAQTDLATATSAWEQHHARGTPPLLAEEMHRALEGLAAAIDAHDVVRAGTATIDVAQSALDHELRYRSPLEVDLARFELWARQVVVDASTRNLAGVRGDVTTMEWVRDRFAHALDRVDVISIDSALMELRNMVNDDDLPGAIEEATALREELATIEPAA